MRMTGRLRGRRALLGAAAVLAVFTAVLLVLGLAASGGVGGSGAGGSGAGGSGAGGDGGTGASAAVLPAPYAAEPAPVVKGDPDGLAAQAPAADSAADSAAGSGGFASEGRSAAKHGTTAAPETAAPGAPVAKIAPPVPGPAPDPGAGTVPPDVAPDRAVIRTARLTLDVKDLPAASAAVRDTAASVGGFVSSEHVVDRSSSFTLRVPSNRLDEVIGRLAAAGTVTERYGQAEDVTDQVVDLESRLATQRASVARVRALLERADTVGEVVAVESELASREAELESLQRRSASVNGRVSMSTLTVALNPVPVAAPAEPGNGFLAGLAAGWRAFVAATGGVLTALGAVLPFALALAVLLGGVLLGRRAVRRHRATEAALAAVAGGSGKS